MNQVIFRILAILLFFISVKSYSWKAGVAFFLLCYEFSYITAKADRWMRLLTAFLMCVVSCVASQFMLGGRLLSLNFFSIIVEILTCLLLMSAVYALTENDRISVITMSVFLLVLTLADYYVAQFRGNELIPTDIRALLTALSVSGQYNWRRNNECFYGMTFWIVIILFYCLSLKWDKNEKLLPRRVAVAATIVCFFLWKYFCRDITIKTWGTNGATINGFYANFSAQIVNLINSREPEGYSTKYLAELENRYKTDKSGESLETSNTLPDIIVILEESFADLSVLGSEINAEEPIIPFFDSLDKNVIKGYALSSVFGGDTANSEYEVLTGNSMAFFNDGISPYQMYIDHPSWSLVSYLKQYGYYSVATHPYYASGWSRSKVYPCFGFDKIEFIESYPQENIIRNRVSDQEMFEHLANLTESRETDEPMFILGITMQNHGGYAYSGPGYTPYISLNGYVKDYADAEQYLGLIHESDKAIEWMIHYYENSERPTVILVFGDHLPNLDMDFYEEIHGGSFADLNDQQQQYTVPFFIWCNYEIETQLNVMTSLNYMNTYLAEVLDIEPSAYTLFLKDVRDEIPAMNAFGYMDASQEGYMTYSDDNDLLKEYEILQYNSVFEKKDRSNVFFPNK